MKGPGVPAVLLKRVRGNSASVPGLTARPARSTTIGATPRPRQARNRQGSENAATSPPRHVVREASGNGPLPVRARRLPPQRRPSDCRRRQGDHPGDRGGVRPEGDASTASGGLRQGRSALAPTKSLLVVIPSNLLLRF